MKKSNLVVEILRISKRPLADDWCGNKAGADGGAAFPFAPF